MDQHAQLLHHLEHAELDGIEELEGDDVITGAVILLRVERPSEDGAALVTMTSGVDYFAQTGMLITASDMVRAADD